MTKQALSDSTVTEIRTAGKTDTHWSRKLGIHVKDDRRRAPWRDLPARKDAAGFGRSTRDWARTEGGCATGSGSAELFPWMLTSWPIT
jgi:hypothetical protein